MTSSFPSYKTWCNSPTSNESRSTILKNNLNKGSFRNCYGRTSLIVTSVFLIILGIVLFLMFYTFDLFNLFTENVVMEKIEVGLPDAYIVTSYNSIQVTLTNVPVAEAFMPESFVVQIQNIDDNAELGESWADIETRPYEVFMNHLYIYGLKENTLYLFRYKIKLKGNFETSSSPPQRFRTLDHRTPDSPRVRIMDLGTDFATLRFMPPGDNGGTEIKLYYLYTEITELGSKKMKTVNMKRNVNDPVIRLPLSPASKVLATPFAENMRGLSSAHAAFTFMTCSTETISKPSTLKLRASSPNGQLIIVRWDVDNEATKLRTIQYELEAEARTSGIVEKSFSMPDRDETVYRIDAYLNSVYRLRMRVKTCAGYSDWSETVEIKTGSNCHVTAPVFVRAHDVFSDGVSFMWYHGDNPKCESNGAGWKVVNGSNFEQVFCETYDDETNWCDAYGMGFEQYNAQKIRATVKSKSKEAQFSNIFQFETLKRGFCTERNEMRYWRPTLATSTLKAYNGTTFDEIIARCKAEASKDQGQSNWADFKHCMHLETTDSSKTPFQLKPLKQDCRECFTIKAACEEQICPPRCKDETDSGECLKICFKSCRMAFFGCSGLDMSNAPLK